MSEESTRRRRRHRPWWRRRTARRVLLLVAVLAVLCVAWTAWSGLTVYRELRDARAAAGELESALRNEDEEASRAAFQELRQSSAVAAERSGGATWNLLGHLPVVGSPIRATEDAAAAIHGLSRGAQPFVEVATGDSELVSRGAFRLEVLERLAEASRELTDELEMLERAAGRLSDSGLPVVARQGDEVLRQVAPVSDSLASVTQVLDELPSALGADGQRRYLLLFQNNAEIRATGGLPGSAAVINARHGRIELERTFSPIVRTAETGAEFEFTSLERDLYGDDLGIGAVFLNSMPDSSRVAGLLREGWEQWFPQLRLDGVATMDTVSLSYLLEATGPVVVDEVELSSANVVSELLYDAYARISDPEQQDAFFESVSERVFVELTSSPKPANLAQAIARMVDERRVSMRMFGGGGGGLNIEAFPEGAVAMGINNVSGDKMSYFLDSSPRVRADACGRWSMTLSMTSKAPKDPTDLPLRLLEPNPSDPSKTGAWHPVPLGSMLLRVVVRLPRGLRFDDSVDGIVRGAGGESYYTELVELAPGQRYDFTVALEGLPRRSSDDIEYVVTPPIQAREASGTFPTGCG